ncbi:hypothetical protein D5086_019363 [Populus alba]|uniref:Uncharacterized protein n=1 Tax=Populus alba TaxID=43335 RepID=A0ACC4BH43_POPAL
MSTADSLSASGRSSEKLSFPSLQSKMKIDPEGCEKDLVWFTANSSRLWSFFNSKHLSISPQPFPSISVTAPRFWLMLHPFTRSNSLSFSNRLLGLCLQGFAEKLIFRLQTCNECFEVIMRSWLWKKHRQHSRSRFYCIFILLFFPQKYDQSSPLQIYSLGLHLPLYVSRVLFPATVLLYQVPPDADEPLFKQIANQFVHDRSRPVPAFVMISLRKCKQVVSVDFICLFQVISVEQEKKEKAEPFRGKKAWK